MVDSPQPWSDADVRQLVAGFITETALLRQQLVELTQRVAALERHPADLLVAAIARVIDGPFAAIELVAKSEKDDALAAALGTQDPRQVGKMLHALAGQSFGPFQIQRAKREKGGRLWATGCAFWLTKANRSDAAEG